MASSRGNGHHVLLAVSGSISAYRAADLVSLLRKGSHVEPGGSRANEPGGSRASEPGGSRIEVRCILTPAGARFVTPLVLETLSGNPVATELFGPDVSGTEHIRLARWADLFVVAPASANLIARLALGLADDLATTVALATRAPWLVAPSMNTAMWENPATRAHVETLRARGAQFVEPDRGALACGEEGEGRLAPAETLAARIKEALARALPARTDLRGLRILITAGPTTSAIDAVRYLTNPSTGRMGAALAEEALARGAEVDYVLGVDKGVVRPLPPAGAAGRLRLTEVRTAEEMLDVALAALPSADAVIATAAVLDYRVERSEPGKLKRASSPLELRLLPSVDVLASLRAAARPGQVFFGFAAETDEPAERGAAKLEAKRLDLLFANRVSRLGEAIASGFGGDLNAGWLIRPGAEPQELPPMPKRALASRLLEELRAQLGRPGADA